VPAGRDHADVSHPRNHSQHHHECAHDKFIARLKRETHLGLREQMRVRTVFTAATSILRWSYCEIPPAVHAWLFQGLGKLWL
jgi:hypothetical protein